MNDIRTVATKSLSIQEIAGMASRVVEIDEALGAIELLLADKEMLQSGEMLEITIGSAEDVFDEESIYPAMRVPLSASTALIAEIGKVLRIERVQLIAQLKAGGITG